jgi:hypothetical protein
MTLENDRDVYQLVGTTIHRHLPEGVATSLALYEPGEGSLSYRFRSYDAAGKEVILGKDHHGYDIRPIACHGFSDGEIIATGDAVLFLKAYMRDKMNSDWQQCVFIVHRDGGFSVEFFHIPITEEPYFDERADMIMAQVEQKLFPSKTVL